MNALVVGSGSYIVWLSVRDLHGLTLTTSVAARGKEEQGEQAGGQREQTGGKRE